MDNFIADASAFIGLLRRSQQAGRSAGDKTSAVTLNVSSISRCDRRYFDLSNVRKCHAMCSSMILSRKVVWTMLLTLQLLLLLFPCANVKGEIVPNEDQIETNLSLQRAAFEAGSNAYKIDYGEYPHGDNAAISRLLFGLNPRKKIYVYLNTNMTFDRKGNLLDPWQRPYRYVSEHQHLTLSSHQNNLDLAKARARGKNLNETVQHTHPPKYTRRLVSDSWCYEVALGARLLVQRQHPVPSRSGLAAMLFLSSGKNFPMISLADPDVAFIDPWGSRYVIELSYGSFSIQSVHSPYVATESFH